MALLDTDGYSINVASNDDAGGTRNSRLPLTMQPGQPSIIRVTGYGRGRGDYTLSVDPAAP